MKKLSEKFGPIIEDIIAYGVDTADTFPSDEDEGFINEATARLITAVKARDKELLRGKCKSDHPAEYCHFGAGLLDVERRMKDTY
jgi:hypothetical protein